MVLEKFKYIVDGYVINCFRSTNDLLKSFNKLVSAHLDEKSTLKSPRQKASDPNGKGSIDFFR